VNAEQRLAEIATALDQVGIRFVVMGGHAVRYYGLNRTTVDFDLQVATESWDSLDARLRATRLAVPGLFTEGASWRRTVFRRFQIGRLADGREEWLEFWRTNHLLSDFEDAFCRREVGMYGGRAIPFMSLTDLIRSKETQRAADWQDVERLEEFLDARNLGRVNRGELPAAAALAQVRSRSGYESFLHAGRLNSEGEVRAALASAQTPMTVGYLLPSAPTAEPPALEPRIEPVVIKKLRTIAPGAEVHLALVEALRRRYRQARQDADRADKEAIRAAQQS
jgi:hypothetical protein